jgi:DNA topoisomerase IA
MIINKPLVIYESPNKFKAFSSMFKDMDVSFCYTQGRIYDLPENEIGLDNNLRPTLVAVDIKREKFLIEKISNHNIIYCLTDNDPEGEWIASHIKEMCDKSSKEFLRLRVSELTKEALDVGLKKSTNLLNEVLLTNAVSRRIIDRVIGYHDNENKESKRGRVITPTLGIIKKNNIELGQTVVIVDADGSQIKLTGEKNSLKLLLDEISQSGEVILTGDHSIESEVELYNTMNFLSDHALYNNANPKEAFEDLQVMYEQGMVSYTRTENTKYEVLSGEHKGIYALDIDLENDDEDKATGTSLDNIKIRTRMHLNKDKYDVRELSPSDNLLCTCEKYAIKINSISRTINKPQSVHEIPRPIFLNKDFSRVKNKLNVFTFNHSKEFALLNILKENNLGTPATFHSHVAKANKLTEIKGDKLTLNSHGTRVSLQTDRLSLTLMGLDNVHEINNLLSNNILSIEQKNEKCLNVLRIYDSTGSDFELDN